MLANGVLVIKFCLYISAPAMILSLTNAPINNNCYCLPNLATPPGAKMGSEYRYNYDTLAEYGGKHHIM